MPLYEHVNDKGEVTERVRPAENSKNAAALAAKAKNDESGWRLVDETGTAPGTAASAPKATSAPSLLSASRPAVTDTPP